MEADTCKTLVYATRLLTTITTALLSVALVVTGVGIIFVPVVLVIWYFVFWKMLKKAEALYGAGKCREAKDKLIIPLVVSILLGGVITFVLLLIPIVGCSDDEKCSPLGATPYQPVTE
ncbi:hypothetical protein [Pyrococcus kukulkanii]|uniref:hypothetical protein n=1 Tax=Pyrococcus kukulkanii TaxID=1609559 RepID=UPI003565EDC7